MISQHVLSNHGRQREVQGDPGRLRSDAGGCARGHPEASLALCPYSVQRLLSLLGHFGRWINS